MTIVLLKRPAGAVCYWCGVEGWIRKCNRCGSHTCDSCWKPHSADSYKFGQERFIGKWVGMGCGAADEGNQSRKSAGGERERKEGLLRLYSDRKAAGMGQGCTNHI